MHHGPGDFEELVQIGAGIGAANIFGAIAYGTFRSSCPSPQSDSAGRRVAIVGYPRIALIPIGMGMVASYFWEKVPLSNRRDRIGPLVTATLSPLGGALFWHEGIVCQVIGGPLFLVS